MAYTPEAVYINDASTIMKGGEGAKMADYANYFCSYSYLYHQKQMLMDNVRMRAYHSAIMSNKKLFEGKTILDVGTGSGVLAMWAAQAGASKVYAVEFTDMANHAKKLIESNGLSHIVEVIQSSVEDLELPCKVDIIISEWMGYLLLRESMLDSVIRARDRWMKEDGSMFPSHATMYWSLLSHENDRDNVFSDYCGSMSEWFRFSNDMSQYYNINVSALSDQFEKEQADYYIHSGIWSQLGIEHVIGEPVEIKKLNLNTCTLLDAAGVDKTPYDIKIPFPIRISGYAGWFTVDFNGSEAKPVDKAVTLSTGPEAGHTHWGQQVFYFRDPIDCSADTKISGHVEMFRQDKNKRLYMIRVDTNVDEEFVVSQTYEIP